MDNYQDLTAKIKQRSARTAVVGLGYVGLPLAVLHAEAGFKVTGIERMPNRVADVNLGRSYIEEVRDDNLTPLVRQERLCATSEFSSLLDADVVAICVPTPLAKDRKPDTSHIEYVVEQGGPYWHSGQLVILESTTYPGTTEEILLPRLTASGLKVGEDIFVAFSPERIDPGNKEFGIRDITRVVGGVTARCTEVAECFYQQLLKAPVFSVSSPKVAEMAKLLENVFRVINSSLVNELAQLCEVMEIDVWEVIEAAKTKPFGFMPFYPGPGVGGHCIPVDPFYLSWKAQRYGFTTQFVDLAGQINDDMPGYVVEKIARLLDRYGKPLSEGANVLLVGVAFKKDVADTRQSAALKVAEGLLERGAILSYHDSHVPTIVVNGCSYSSTPLTSEALRDADVVVITTDHTDVNYSLIARNSQMVYDTRNALRDFKAKHIHRLGAPEFIE